MERVLVLIDETGINRETMEFATYIANLTKSKLTAVFLESPSFTVHSDVPVAEQKARSIGDMKMAFTRFCDNHQLGMKPELIEVTRLEDVYLQTRFADLIIINADTGATGDREVVPSHVATAVLKNAECPVFVAPLSCKPMNEIVFTYDGSPSSVFAIREFTHLFPEFSEMNATFLEVNPDFTSDINFKKSITDYLDSHYKYVSHLILKGSASDEIFAYLLDKKDVIVVMGSYGKKFLHSVFHRSTASLLLKTTTLPVFISHK